MNVPTEITPKAEPGIFYAVGVGPGSPDLLTVRAVGIIISADWIIAPRSRIAKESLALEAVRPFITGEQEVYEHVYAMKRNEEATLRSWESVAQETAQRLLKNQSVVQITIGDPLIYSTTAYLADRLSQIISADAIRIIPGISSFQSAATRFCDPLVIQEDRLMLMTATDLDKVEHALDHAETVVLYKAGKVLDKLAELLEQKGLSEKASLVCYVEQPDREFVSRNIKEAAKDHLGYMSTVIIQTGRCKWNETA